MITLFLVLTALAMPSLLSFAAYPSEDEESLAQSLASSFFTTVLSYISFTTLGHLGQSELICGDGFVWQDLHGNPTNHTLTLECGQGTIASVEAYYGNVSGTCGCPTEQQPRRTEQELARKTQPDRYRDVAWRGVT